MIRNEQETDVPLVRYVHEQAFPTTAEADLVDGLRDHGHLIITLVATDEAGLVGHIGFSPVQIENVTLTGLGLAPVAVLPSKQGQGIGGDLIRAGLGACRRRSGIDYVVVLGEPEYYQRFGFKTASQFGLGNEYEVDAEFMVIELTENCLANISGVVRYGDEFRELS